MPRRELADAVVGVARAPEREVVGAQAKAMIAEHATAGLAWQLRPPADGE